MSNLGLEKYLTGIGLTLVRTAVGDRYVLERMRADGYNLGGEQSGHVILADYATTGDGTVAALQALAVLVESGQPASTILRPFEPLPQTLKNVRLPAGTDSKMILDRDAIKGAIAAAEAELKGSGRLLIRKSGTEPLIRVMAEGDDATKVGRVVDQLVATISAAAQS